MKCTISFKHLEHTESLDQRIHEKTEQFCKYFNDMAEAKWICYVKDGNHYAEVTVQGPKFKYHAKATADSLYKCIDLALGKVEKQLHKKKDQWKHKLHSQMKDKIVILDPEQAWYENDGEYHFEKMKKAA